MQIDISDGLQTIVKKRCLEAVQKPWCHQISLIMCYHVNKLKRLKKINKSISLGYDNKIITQNYISKL